MEKSQFRSEKTERLITVETAWKETNVIVGGTIKMSIEDARAIVLMTQDFESEEQAHMVSLQCMTILKNMASAILYDSESLNLDLYKIADKYK